jgi:hypothetical protein
MRGSERFNRESAALGYYRMLTKKAGFKITDEAAKQKIYDECESFMLNTHWWYSKSNLPMSAHGGDLASRALNLAYTFRPFTHNYVLSLAYSFLNYGGTGGLIYAARSFAWLIAIGGVPALPWLDDLVEMVTNWTGIPFKAQARKRIEKLAGTEASKFMGAGLAGMVGADLSASIRPAGIPSFLTGGAASESLLGVYSGMGGKFSKFISELKLGEYARAFESISPVAAENLFKAWRLYEKGGTTSAKNPIYNKKGELYKLDIEGFLMQAGGVKSLDYSLIMQDEWERKLVLQHFSKEKASLVKQQHLAKTEKEMERVQLKMDVFNASIPPYLAGIVKYVEWVPLEKPNWKQQYLD